MGLERGDESSNIQETRVRQILSWPSKSLGALLSKGQFRKGLFHSKWVHFKPLFALLVTSATNN